MHIEHITLNYSNLIIQLHIPLSKPDILTNNKCNILNKVTKRWVTSDINFRKELIIQYTYIRS